MRTSAQLLWEGMTSRVDFTDANTVEYRNNAFLRRYRARWNMLKDILLVNPTIFPEDVLTTLMSHTMTSDTFHNIVLGRIMQTYLPTAMRLSYVPALDISENENVSLLKVPQSIYEVYSILLYIHWCADERALKFPVAILNHLTPDDAEQLKNSMLVFAAKQIATLSMVNRELWSKFKDLYVEAINNYELGWVFNHVFIQFTEHWTEFQDSKCLMCLSMNCEGDAVAEYHRICSGLQYIVSASTEILGSIGVPLNEYLRDIVKSNSEVTIKEDISVNKSLEILDKLLRESVVITSQGEVLNVEYDTATQGVVIAPHVVADPANAIEGRPVITHCKIVVGGEEQDLIHVSEEELSSILAAASNVVAATEHDSVGHEAGVVRIPRIPVPHAVPEESAVRTADGRVVPGASVGLTRRPQMYQYNAVPVDGPVEGDIRVNAGGSHSVYRSVNLDGNTVGMWMTARPEDIAAISEHIDGPVNQETGVERVINPVFDRETADHIQAVLDGTEDEDEVDGDGDDWDGEEEDWEVEEELELDPEEEEELDEPQLVRAPQAMAPAPTTDQTPEDGRAWMRLPDGRIVYI